MSLVSGAWIDPSFTGSYTKMTFGALVGTSSSNWTRSSDGISKSHVDKARAGTNGGKILVSFGGSAYEGQILKDMGGDPQTYSKKMIDFVASVGADGVDYDCDVNEIDVGFTDDVIPGLAEMMKIIKESGNNLIQTLTVAPSADFLSYQRAIDVVEYVIVRFYTYDWNRWLSLMDKWNKSMGSQNHKLIIGITVSNPGITLAIVDKAIALCQEKSWAGLFFWWYADYVTPQVPLNQFIDQIP